VDPDVLSAGLGRVVKLIHYRGKEVYSIKENNCLNGLLGLKWNERILNQNGVFSYVVKGTVKYWLSHRQPKLRLRAAPKLDCLFHAMHDNDIGNI